MRARALVLMAGVLLGALPSGSAAQAVQATCRAQSGPDAEAGWGAYAAGDMAAVRTRFEAALALCASDHYARTGLAYVSLRADDLDGAVALWTTVVVAEPENVDALTGLGLVAWRRADLEQRRGFVRPGHRARAGPPDGARVSRAHPWPIARSGPRETAARAPGRARLSGTHGGRPLRGARRGRMDALLHQGRESGRRAAGPVPEPVSGLSHLRPVDRGDGGYERQRRARLHHPEAREQLRTLRGVFAANASPTLSFESDSDGNRMRTAALASSWYATPRWRLRADLFEKGLRQDALERSSLGVTVSTAYVLEPGWTLGGALGGSRTDGPAASTCISAQASVTTPGRHRYDATLAAQTAVLDATAALATTGVRMTETSLTGRWQPAAAWRFDANAGYAVFDGSERNSRTNGALSLSRTLGAGFTLGVAGRVFAYEKDLQDGYFDPDFYGIGEFTSRWLGRDGDLSLLLELAPGIQQVTRDGSSVHNRSDLGQRLVRCRTGPGARPVRRVFVDGPAKLFHGQRGLSLPGSHPFRGVAALMGRGVVSLAKVLQA